MSFDLSRLSDPDCAHRDTNSLECVSRYLLQFQGSGRRRNLFCVTFISWHEKFAFDLTKPILKEMRLLNDFQNVVIDFQMPRRCSDEYTKTRKEPRITVATVQASLDQHLGPPIIAKRPLRGPDKRLNARFWYFPQAFLKYTTSQQIRSEKVEKNTKQTKQMLQSRKAVRIQTTKDLERRIVDEKKHMLQSHGNGTLTNRPADFVPGRITEIKQLNGVGPSQTT